MELVTDPEERAEIDDGLAAPVAVSDKASRRAWAAAAAAAMA